jgi:hypothetical protein
MNSTATRTSSSSVCCDGVLLWEYTCLGGEVKAHSSNDSTVLAVVLTVLHPA